MKWQDMILEKNLNSNEVAVGLATAFMLDISEIHVSNNAEDICNPTDAKIVCIQSSSSEGYRCKLSLFAYYDTTNIDEMSIIFTIADVFCTNVLISDDSPNPYTMVCVKPNGLIVNVSIDVDRLDNKEEYHVKLLK